MTRVIVLDEIDVGRTCLVNVHIYVGNTHVLHPKGSLKGSTRRTQSRLSDFLGSVNRLAQPKPHWWNDAPSMGRNQWKPILEKY